ncbi:MAG: hypothetical protein IJO14_01755 [Clostridia bacterium]|nr:hypothetical protein [Clostridia bacterium]
MSDMKEQNNTFKEEELSSFAASLDSDHADLQLLDEDDPYDSLLQTWDASNENLARRKQAAAEVPQKKKVQTGFAVRRRAAVNALKTEPEPVAEPPKKEIPMAIPVAIPVEEPEDNKVNSENPVVAFGSLLKNVQPKNEPEAEPVWSEIAFEEEAQPQTHAAGLTVRSRSQGRKSISLQNPQPVRKSVPLSTDRESVVFYRPYDEENEPELENMPERGLAMFSKSAEKLLFGKKQHPKNEKKVRLVSQIISVLFAVLLFAVAIVNFAAPDKEFSESENRRLEQMPKLSLSTIANGSFMSDFETSLTDQFVMRDFFVKLRTRALVALGKAEVNDVYIADDSYLIPKPPVPNEDIAKSTMEAIAAVAAKKPKIQQYCAFIPRASYIHSDLLPNGAMHFDDKALIESMAANNTAENLKHIRVSDALAAAAQTQQVYYRTDHHWTTAGAFAAFGVIAQEMQLNTAGVAYEIYTVSDSFAGTSSSSSGVYQVTDSVEICIPKNKQTCIVEMPQESKKYTSMFMYEFLEKKDKYAVFFGGNPSIVNISTDADSVDTLLILKDSYANALVPMLTPYYRNIIMIDPRYYMESFDSFLQTHRITDILYLFSIESATNAEALQRFLVS